MDIIKNIREFFTAFPVLMNLLSCLMVLVVCIIVWQLGKRVISGIFEKTKKTTKLHIQVPEQYFKKVDTARTITQSILKYLVFVVGALIILQIFGVPVGSLLTVAGVGGIAVGIGAQSLVKDILNGIFIWFESHFSVGDTVKIKDMIGVIEDFNFRTTRIRSFDGDLHIIPNGEIRCITNRSKGIRRVIQDVSISFDEDVNKVIEIIGSELKTAEEEIADVIGNGTVLGVSALSDVSVTIKFCIDCEPGSEFTVEREMLKRIHSRFKQEAIRLPHPHYIISKPDVNCY